jgi:hypothetical protein
VLLEPRSCQGCGEKSFATDHRKGSGHEHFWLRNVGVYAPDRINSGPEGECQRPFGVGIRTLRTAQSSLQTVPSGDSTLRFR